MLSGYNKEELIELLRETVKEMIVAQYAENATKVIEDNKLVIKYNDIELQRFTLTSVSSETYDLTKEYIYTKAPGDTVSINVSRGYITRTFDIKL